MLKRSIAELITLAFTNGTLLHGEMVVCGYRAMLNIDCTSITISYEDSTRIVMVSLRESDTVLCERFVKALGDV